MKVIKSGDSSLASAEQPKKVSNIVESDSERCFVIVSVPSKRNAKNTKVTGTLTKYYKTHTADGDVTVAQEWTISRRQAMAEELGLNSPIVNKVAGAITNLVTLPIDGNGSLYDTFLAAGEDNDTKLVTKYFRKNGIATRYVHPKGAGIIVFSGPRNAHILPPGYDRLEGLCDSEEVLVIPGFFGVTTDGQICTFSRGGSDISGSIVAVGVKADLYENSTDINGIFAAHPGVVYKLHAIRELIYRKIRELAYAGFSVLHGETLIPTHHSKISLVIKNTNNSEHPGARITLKHSGPITPVIGIAVDDNFTSINVSKYLMNREAGFGRKALQILEDLNIYWGRMPTGIDDMSVIVREYGLISIKEQEIISYPTQELGVDEVGIEHNLSVIMIVGEDMKNHIGAAATAARALSDKHINLEMISQGSGEVSIMFVTQTEQGKQTVHALYSAFFTEEQN